MKAFNGLGAKLMASMFSQVENVSYDLSTGKTGIKTDAGFLSLGDDNVLNQDPLDFFSMEIPAFAMLTPMKDIKRGDLLVNNGKAYAFLLQDGFVSTEPDSNGIQTLLTNPYERKSIETMGANGHVSRYVPKKVSMMGVTNGLLVVRSFTNLFGSGDSPDNAMQSMLPMLLMMNQKDGKDSGMESMLPLMMMSGMAGGNQGSMNPMLMMMLMGKGASFFE